MRTVSKARVPRLGAVLNLYRDVWLHMQGRRWIFVGAVGLLVSAQVVLLAVPYGSGRALNALQLHGVAGFRNAALWLSMGLLIACGSWILHGPGRILERRAALLVRQRLSASLVEHLFRLPLQWHEAHQSGATAHRLQQSSQALANFAQSQFIYLNSAVRLLGPLVALCWVQPVVGMSATGGFALIIGSVVGFDRVMLKLANQENDAERDYSATLIDTLSNAETVYAQRQARAVTARIQRRLSAVFVPLRRAIVVNELKWLTVDLSTRVLNCCLVGPFVWLASQPTSMGTASKTLLLGSLYMVWEYAQQAASVIASIASHFQTFARQSAEYASADVIRRSTPSPTLPVPMSSAARWQRLSVRDLSFRHAAAGGAETTLDRLTLCLERGKRYALIGGSGSGKSTLLRVLAGLYPAERIALTLDDGATHVSSTEAAQLLRARATLIPQDAEVYAGTLGENLGLCESVLGSPTREEYSSALEAACAADFVESTPWGLEVPVGERAGNWSGGQRSRIALARGVLAACGSSLVLMDEPTASLDASTEARVYTNFFAFFEDACIISSVHRLSLLDQFDQILVMQGGRLVAQGCVDELALTCPEFQRLTALHSIRAPQTPFGAERPRLAECGG